MDFDCNVIFNFQKKKKIVNDLLFELVAFKFLLKIKTMIGILLFEKILYIT